MVGSFLPAPGWVFLGVCQWRIKKNIKKKFRIFRVGNGIYFKRYVALQTFSYMLLNEYKYAYVPLLLPTITFNL